LPVLRRRPAGRTRGCLLRSTPETSRRLRSQIRESPDSPGRFRLPTFVLLILLAAVTAVYALRGALRAATSLMRGRRGADR
ncbi:hypothetical protein EUA95_21240, partial [Mycobacterium tuberculosis]